MWSRRCQARRQTAILRQDRFWRAAAGRLIDVRAGADFGLAKSSIGRLEDITDRPDDQSVPARSAACGLWRAATEEERGKE
jgi:hypothetical protein